MNKQSIGFGIGVQTALGTHYVRLDRACDQCRNGVIPNPEWQEWGAKWDKFREAIAGLQHEGCDHISGDEGCDLCILETNYFAAHPLPKEPEEEPCGECEGNGFVLTPEGFALLQFFDRYRGQEW